MLLLPIEHITYSTKLSEEEIVMRLADWVEPPLPVKWFQPYGAGYEKRYTGKIKEHEFNIERVIGYRNTFLPTITGTIREGAAETTIKVEMRLSFLSMIFLLGWLGFIGPFAIGVLTMVFKGGQLSDGDLVPVGMVLGFYLIVMFGFKIESYKSRKELKTILEAEITRS